MKVGTESVLETVSSVKSTGPKLIIPSAPPNPEAQRVHDQDWLGLVSPRSFAILGPYCVIVSGSSPYCPLCRDQRHPLLFSSYYGLSLGYYYTWINDGGSASADVNFIIGQKIFENYYSVYDTTKSRIGFATRA